MTHGEAPAARDHCGAARRSDNAPCQRPAGWGTDHVGLGRCKLHGGCTPNHVTAARKALAVEAAVTFGLPVDIDPQQALLDEVHRSAGMVAYYQHQAIAADEDEGLIAEGMFGEYPVIWLKLLAEERQHLVAVAATCVKLGLDERRVRLAEQEGQLLANVLRGVLADLGVTNHPDAAQVVRKHLALAAAA